MIRFNYKSGSSFLVTGVFLIGIILLASCKKYNYTGFTPGKGSPTISSVHTLSRIDTTTITTTYISYDENGNKIEVEKYRSRTPYAYDSATVTGNLDAFYIIYGSSLGSATKVTFNGIEAYFNRALITDESIITQIPTKTPYSGDKATGKLVVTTLYGEATYDFEILPPPPTAKEYSDFNFREGSQITVTGLSLNDVSKVTITDKDDQSNDLNIISKSETKLVIGFSGVDINRGNLNFFYENGGSTAEAKDENVELVNIDKAYAIFLDDEGENDWWSWSWGPTGVSTDKAKNGSASFFTKYGAASWWINGFRQGGGGADDGVSFSEGYQYLSFWVLGGARDETVHIEFGDEDFAQDDYVKVNEIKIPAGVWTYFKIPISTLNWNATGKTWADYSSSKLNTVAFFMWDNEVEETFYFDDLILLK